MFCMECCLICNALKALQCRENKHSLLFSKPAVQRGSAVNVCSSVVSAGHQHSGTLALWYWALWYWAHWAPAALWHWAALTGNPSTTWRLLLPQLGHPCHSCYIHLFIIIIIASISFLLWQGILFWDPESQSPYVQSKLLSTSPLHKIFLPIFPLNANAMISSICFGLRHLCLQTQQQISFCHQFTIWD